MSNLFSSASAEMEKILERMDGHRCLDNGGGYTTAHKSQMSIENLSTTKL
ncbi:hypothetical protein [Candidatus Nitrosocosmicus arcticus]|uniref:Uncharacterized protein n=1 Tax=Candidatus Nitrosocosmicus arcticus TaxID=2035267 RepID=A0A557SYA0_9ARCH|nr:hypothetical protein [Candidatus Nitrosocosmicus arcticus]TVP41584.1 hypothetical protein NARC_30299 [Candidatus Nitrosocosmicus arcticus]